MSRYSEMIDRTKLELYGALMRARPEQVGMLVKAALRVKRRHVRSPQGCTFWIDPITPFGLHLLKREVYEPQMVALVTKLLRPHDTFVDLGANEGFFSILAASVATQGRVVAVEPQARLRGVLLENARVNGLRNLSVHTLALSDQEGEARLFLRSTINHTASRLNHRFRLGFGTQAVRTSTLDLLCKREAIDRARLLKMDCEGAEVQIVPGAREVFARRAFDVIALEYHPPICGWDACRTIHDQVSSCGYKFASWKGQTLYYLPDARADLGAVSPDIDLDAKFG